MGRGKVMDSRYYSAQYVAVTRKFAELGESYDLVLYITMVCSPKTWRKSVVVYSKSDEVSLAMFTCWNYVTTVRTPKKWRAKIILLFENAPKIRTSKHSRIICRPKKKKHPLFRAGDCTDSESGNSHHAFVSLNYFKFVFNEECRIILFAPIVCVYTYVYKKNLMCKEKERRKEEKKKKKPFSVIQVPRPFSF